jgi:hypothetical protein
LRHIVERSHRNSRERLRRRLICVCWQVCISPRGSGRAGGAPFDFAAMRWPSPRHADLREGLRIGPRLLWPCRGLRESGARLQDRSSKQCRDSRQ